MIFNAEQDLHTGEVVGSIPTAPTILLGFLGTTRNKPAPLGSNGTLRRGADVEYIRRLFYAGRRANKIIGGRRRPRCFISLAANEGAIKSYHRAGHRPTKADPCGRERRSEKHR